MYNLLYNGSYIHKSIKILNFELISSILQIPLSNNLQTMKGNCIKIIVFNYTNCEYSEIDGLSPLRTVVPCPSNQAQTIEFLKRVGKQFKCNS